MTYLLAPTEHALHKQFSSNGVKYVISSLPEKHGCDIFSTTPAGIVGYQRKTLPDLHASLLDGRLYKELAQLEATATVAHPYLIIESDLRRTTDGQLLEAPITIDAFRSVLCKFAAYNVAYLPTNSVFDTCQAIISTTKYISSPSFTHIRRPKQTTNSWGKKTSNSYALFLLQSFPNIGPSLAAAILKHFGHTPINWTVTADDLAKVPGIGKKRAQALIDSLT